MGALQAARPQGDSCAGGLSHEVQHSPAGQTQSQSQGIAMTSRHCLRRCPGLRLGGAALDLPDCVLLGFVMCCRQYLCAAPSAQIGACNGLTGRPCHVLQAVTDLGVASNALPLACVEPPYMTPNWCACLLLRFAASKFDSVTYIEASAKGCYLTAGGVGTELCCFTVASASVVVPLMHCVLSACCPADLQ